MWPLEYQAARWNRPVTQERRHCVTIRRNAANRRHPFSVARLDGLWLADPIGARYYCPRPNHADCETRLVKVVEVAVLGGVRLAHIGDEAEPRV